MKGDRTMDRYLDISQLSIQFPRSPVLKGINLEVHRGEFITLIGHSGCGKSTVLNIVAGLLRASLGGVLLEGREVNASGPDRAVVFQNHSLLSWLTVRENVGLIGFVLDRLVAGVGSLVTRGTSAA